MHIEFTAKQYSWSTHAMQKGLDFRTFLLVSALAFCVSCGTGEKEVQGSVFIVTQGADNIKLGLVKVSALKESEITKFVEEKKAAVNDATTKLKNDADSLKPSIDKCQTEFDEAVKTYDGAKSQLDALKNREQALDLEFTPYISPYISPYADETETAAQAAEISKQRQIGNQLTAIRKQIGASEVKLAKLDTEKTQAENRLNGQKAMLTALQAKILGFINPAFLLDGIPEGKVKTVTDADGKFSMNLPIGKYALVAASQRRVGATTEDYNWVVWIEVNSDGAKQITLSNQNMLGEDADDSVFKIRELVPSPDNPPDKTKDVNFKI